MMFDPDRHEPLRSHAWDAERARAMIVRIAGETEAAFAPYEGWRAHSLDDPHAPRLHGLYFGACGVLWALHYLQARGAVTLTQDYGPQLPFVSGWHGAEGSYLMGELGVLLLRQWLAPEPQHADRIASLVAGNVTHPARELMWGAPGSMLAALFLHGRDGDARWADLFLRSARQLWSELAWSGAEQCRFWTQDLYGRQSTYLDAVHGFAATASVVIQGRHLLPAEEWQRWQSCIVETVTRTAEREGPLANWRSQLSSPRGARKLVQYCHGAPGFVICLADHPDAALDDLLRAAGETAWAAGPLRKGANLCHGTGGNGYAFLKLYRRFAEPLWLERARAFAMHAIAQAEAARDEYAQWRHSLWTGDPGLAIYLLDCIEEGDRFPTLDVFFADARAVASHGLPRARG